MSDAGLRQTGLTVTALAGIPRVEPGDDLAALLIAALQGNGTQPRAHDILVVTSKIVSKAEGRYLDLDRIEPSERARELAQITRKDARLVEAILSEATEVIRAPETFRINLINIFRSRRTCGKPTPLRGHFQAT